MANDLPQLQVNVPVPGDVQTFDQPVATGLAEVAQTASNMAARMGQIADRAKVVQAESEAAGDAQAGRVAPRSEMTAWGHAYNVTAKEMLLSQRQAAMVDQMGALAAANPDNPALLQEKFKAVRAGFGSSGYRDLDVRMDGAFALHQAALLNDARSAQHKVQVATAQSAVQQTLATYTTQLSQAAATAPLDAGGQARIDAMYAQALDAVGKWGPKTAFSAGGRDFPADETRAQVSMPDDIDRYARGMRSLAKEQQLVASVDRLPDSAAKKAAVADLKDRWGKGDGLLSGLDPGDYDKTMQRLDAVVNRTETNERADRMEKEQHAGSLLEAYVAGGQVSPEDVKQAAAATGDPGIIAKTNFVVANGGKPAGNDFNTIWGVVRDQFENNAVPKRDINGAWVKFGINQAAFPNVDVQHLTQDDATKIARQIWDEAGIDNLPPGLRAVTFDAAFMHGAGKAKAWAQRAMIDPQSQTLPGGAVQFFQAERLAEMHRLGVANPAKYGPVMKGWETRVRNVTMLAAQLGGDGADATAKMMAGAGAPGVVVPEGMNSNPIGYAYTHNLASAVPLNPMGAFSQHPQDMQAFATSLASRYAQAGALAQKYNVPIRMLQPNEADVLKQQIKANPAAAVTLANVAGPRATALFNELDLNGADASTEVLIGQLASHGSVPFAQTAAQGLTLKANGNKGEPFPTGKGLPEAYNTVREAFELVPGLAGPAMNTAAAAHLAESQSGKGRTPQEYLAHSVGANTRNGLNYGGFGEVNGRATIVPSWLRPERMQAAWAQRVATWAHEPNALPVYSNGKPMPAHEVMGMQLLMQADGTYLLRSPRTGYYAKTKDGRPFAWDPEKARQSLKAAMPDAVDLSAR